MPTSTSTRVAPGDIAPRVSILSSTGEIVDLASDENAGRFQVLLFCPSAPAVEAANRWQAVRPAFDANRVLVFMVLPMALPPGVAAAFPALIESTGTFAAAYGLSAGAAILVGPNQHILAIMPLEGGAERIVRLIEARSPAWQERFAEPHAPVLVVPDVLSPDECRNLIGIYRMQGNVFVEPGHGQQGMTNDYKMRIPEYGRGDRIDHWIANPETNRWLDQRISSRLFPEVRRAFHYRVTRREMYRIGCYEGARGGDLHGHRDNTAAEVAHRRFSLSINLNAEDFEGGDIAFAEFGGQRYHPPSGAAIVFSSSLLHEVLEVRKGHRYVLLAFLFGDQ